METILDKISVRIIKEQELIIGSLAWDEARKVTGLKIIDQENGVIELQGDSKTILNNLVAQYSHLFGRASNEVCREVTKDLVKDLPADQIPESLR